jgi:hypothetical protein
MSVSRLVRPAAFVLLIFALLPATGCVTRENVLLTWRGDTSTSMSVSFQSTAEAPGVVYYDTEPRGGDPAAYAFSAEDAPRTINGIDKRWFYTGDMTGLEPGGTYYFIAGTEEGGFSREHKFRTIPATGALRFVEGGDQAITPLARRLMRAAATHEPHFAVIGGDLAYANGDTDNLWIWDIYHFNYRNRFVTPEGYLVPVMFGIGNHEVNDKDDAPDEERAPFYLTMINQAESTNFVREAGDHTVFIFLDTGHVQTHESQNAWLEEQLEAYADVPNLFAIYHVPFYPSHRSFDDSRSVAGRTHWAPLFEKHQITAGFEHHDHTFKRTHRITAGELDPEKGILYLGDGSMGVPVRSADNRDAWYHEKASGTAHFWLVDVDAGSFRARAYNDKNEVFDDVAVEHAAE